MSIRNLMLAAPLLLLGVGAQGPAGAMPLPPASVLAVAAPLATPVPCGCTPPPPAATPAPPPPASGQPITGDTADASPTDRLLGAQAVLRDRFRRHLENGEPSWNAPDSGTSTRH